MLARLACAKRAAMSLATSQRSKHLTHWALLAWHTGVAGKVLERIRLHVHLQASCLALRLAVQLITACNCTQRSCSLKFDCLGSLMQETLTSSTVPALLYMMLLPDAGNCSTNTDCPRCTSH